MKKIIKRMKLKTKWKALSPSVRENQHGDRVHNLGCISFQSVDGRTTISNIDTWEKIKERHLCLRIMGGNNLRGLMLMSERLRADLINS